MKERYILAAFGKALVETPHYLFSRDICCTGPGLRMTMQVKR